MKKPGQRTIVSNIRINCSLKSLLPVIRHEIEAEGNKKDRYQPEKRRFKIKQPDKYSLNPIEKTLDKIHCQNLI